MPGFSICSPGSRTSAVHSLDQFPFPEGLAHPSMAPATCWHRSHRLVDPSNGHPPRLPSPWHPHGSQTGVLESCVLCCYVCPRKRGHILIHLSRHVAIAHRSAKMQPGAIWGMFLGQASPPASPCIEQRVLFRAVLSFLQGGACQPVT